jgi:hypothetical protein
VHNAKSRRIIVHPSQAVIPSYVTPGGVRIYRDGSVPGGLRTDHDDPPAYDDPSKWGGPRSGDRLCRHVGRQQPTALHLLLRRITITRNGLEERDLLLQNAALRRFPTSRHRVLERHERLVVEPSTFDAHTGR